MNEEFEDDNELECLSSSIDPEKALYASLLQSAIEDASKPVNISSTMTKNQKQRAKLLEEERMDASSWLFDTSKNYDSLISFEKTCEALNLNADMVRTKLLKKGIKNRTYERTQGIVLDKIIEGHKAPRKSLDIQTRNKLDAWDRFIEKQRFLHSLNLVLYRTINKKKDKTKEFGHSRFGNITKKVLLNEIQKAIFQKVHKIPHTEGISKSNLLTISVASLCEDAIADKKYKFKLEDLSIIGYTNKTIATVDLKKIIEAYDAWNERSKGENWNRIDKIVLTDVSKVLTRRKKEKWKDIHGSLKEFNEEEEFFVKKDILSVESGDSCELNWFLESNSRKFPEIIVEADKISDTARTLIESNGGEAKILEYANEQEFKKEVLVHNIRLRGMEKRAPYKAEITITPKLKATINLNIVVSTVTPKQYTKEEQKKIRKVRENNLAKKREVLKRFGY